LKQSVLRELRCGNNKRQACNLLNASSFSQNSDGTSSHRRVLMALLLNGNEPVLKHVFLRKHEVFEIPSQSIDDVCRTKTVEFIDQFVKEVLMQVSV
jgi:hypothetical protein